MYIYQTNTESVIVFHRYWHTTDVDITQTAITEHISNYIISIVGGRELGCKIIFVYGWVIKLDIIVALGELADPNCPTKNTDGGFTCISNGTYDACSKVIVYWWYDARRLRAKIFMASVDAPLWRTLVRKPRWWYQKNHPNIIVGVLVDDMTPLWCL